MNKEVIFFRHIGYNNLIVRQSLLLMERSRVRNLKKLNLCINNTVSTLYPVRITVAPAYSRILYFSFITSTPSFMLRPILKNIALLNISLINKTMKVVVALKDTGYY